MKKFLIFLVAIVVVVCFGLTIFYFVRNDEVINFTTKEIYCNVGDKIYNDELGLTVKKRNKKTTYNYNAGGEDVTKFVEYDSKYGQYDVKATEGGDYTITITTSNKKFAKFEIIVHVGDGTVNHPYYISSVGDLEKIGLPEQNGGYQLFGSNANYVLMNDISLPATFKPIAEGSHFGGSFDGQGHTISNLNVTEAGEAGLFAELEGARIFNLKLKDFNLSGNFTAAGALAARADSTTVDRVVVENSTIASVDAGAVAGGKVAGLIGEAVNDSLITRAYVIGTSISGKEIAGGLVGELNCSTIKATYVKDVTFVSTGATEASAIGGLVGKYVISTLDGSIQQSYAVANFGDNTYHGTFIGKIDVNTPTFMDSQATAQKNVYLVGNYAQTKSGENPIYAVETKTGEIFKELNNKVAGKENLIGLQKDFVFYSYTINIDEYSEEVTELWDADNTWKFSSTSLPQLKMVNNQLFGISNEFVNFAGNSYTKVGEANSDNIENLRKLLNGESGEINENILFAKDAVYNFQGKEITNPQALANISIFGNGATIENLKVSKYLFESLDNCTIKNLTFKNLTFTGDDAQGLIGTVTSSNKNSNSEIINVKVVYNTPVNTTAYFGGLAKKVENGTIQNCSVEGLNATYTGSGNSRLAGVVAENNGIISQISVKDIVLTGAAYMGGIASYNTGDIVNFSGNVKIDTLGAYVVGGVADENVGHITSGNNYNLDITVVNGTKDGAYIGGVVGVNSIDTENKKAGVVNDVTINGSITFDAQNLGALNKVYVGGVVSQNAGEIANVNNKLTQVGTFGTNKTIEGKNFYVGGVAYENEGTINKVVVTSNLVGNYVAGAVVEMRAGNMNEVFVGADLTNKNTIEGDKLVAGVAVGVSVKNIERNNNSATYSTVGNATIANTQTNSKIVGKTNSTISSLVTLIFPDGAAIRTAAINNAAEGYGTLYKETWTDFDGSNDFFNVFGTNGKSGNFESVVINTAHLADTLTKKQSFFNWTVYALVWADTDYNEVNYFKYVNDADFNNANTFRGQYTQLGDGTNGNINGGDNGSRWYGRVEETTFTMQFGDAWTLNNGATLAFLSDVFAD